MEKTGLHRMYRWRPSARFGCLSVFVLSGILTACVIAYYLEGIMWEPPLLETRMKVEAALYTCTLKESELPDEWSKGWSASLPLEGRHLSGPSGMLGGIFASFSHKKPETGWAASHELQFYERLDQVVYFYIVRRIGFISRWQRTWVPLDLTQANLAADEYRATCADFVPDIGQGRGEKTCETKTRYGKFLSVFQADLSPSTISVEEYIQLLQIIDRKMLQCVDLFADKKWREE